MNTKCDCLKALIIENYIEIFKQLKDLVSEVIDIDNILWASNTEEAVELINREMPEVIILDTGLLNNKSYEILKTIKKNDSKSLVIVLSNTTDIQLEADCLLYGADYFLDKYNEFDKIPVLISLQKTV